MMDIATLAGLVGGAVLTLLAVLMASGSGQSFSLAQFIDPPALLLVLGGGLCVVMASVPLRVFLTLPKLLVKLLFCRAVDHRALVAQLISLAEVARRDGLLALEPRLAEIENASIVLGLQMAIDGTRPNVLEDVFQSEIAAEDGRHQAGKRMFELLGRCGPALGMIATLIGLILMLGHLDDPDSIGPNMAMALVGTLYGAGLANLICAPCAEKLAYLSRQEALGKQIVLKGILAIQAGENPRIIEQKLMTYLPPALRATTRADAAA